MEKLHEDHRHLDRLLDVLERGLREMQMAGDPDYMLMLEVVDYIATYPDQIHHPREDVLYQAALKKAPTLRGEIDSMLTQHVLMTDDTHYLRDALSGVINDTLQDRAGLEDSLGRFIFEQRRHILQEERDLFPRIEGVLSVDDLRGIEKALPPVDDPLFGRQVEERYRELYAHIMAEFVQQAS